MLRPKLVIIDLLEDGVNDTTQLTKMSPVGIVTNVAICPKTAPFLKNYALVACALREDTSNMPVQLVIASNVLCLCLPLTDVLKDIPGGSDVTDVT